MSTVPNLLQVQKHGLVLLPFPLQPVCIALKLVLGHSLVQLKVEEEEDLDLMEEC